MDKFKHILFEYSTLIDLLVMLFVTKLFIFPGLDSKIFAIAIFVIYLRHHHLGSEVVVEKISKTITATRSVKRKSVYWLDIPTFAIAFLFLSNVTSFYWSTLIFVFWFILTDILRVRYTIYGTYISRWFYTSKININNNKWRINKADADPFPSVPHMHALNAPLKLNIYTGQIYDTRNKKLVDVASKKDLKKLWSDKEFVEAVKNARQIYKNNNPKYNLPTIPVFE